MQHFFNNISRKIRRYINFFFYQDNKFQLERLFDMWIKLDGDKSIDQHKKESVRANLFIWIEFVL